jgi:hypothetical protein
MRESEEYPDLDRQQQEPPKNKGSKVLPARHWRGNEPLEQLFLPRLNNPETERPHCCAH